MSERVSGLVPGPDFPFFLFLSERDHPFQSPPPPSRHLYPPLFHPSSSSLEPTLDLPLGSLPSSLDYLLTEEGPLYPDQRTPRHLLGACQTLVVDGAAQAGSRSRSLHRLLPNYDRQAAPDSLRHRAPAARGHSSVPGVSAVGLAARGLRARPEVGHGAEAERREKGDCEAAGGSFLSKPLLSALHALGSGC